ncbi:hypothetical protein ThidrDRAFT_3009 [Thiorhodococcus drewsii AZ1]|uniref:Reverse transcriptase domain-containing protein n=1 Tax=Thiorhodococcus drewsii AZ1 TaxID=765913 RepID=G2E3Z6_9GAMM|nr:antiviral reverse transcriptase Drt3b [Thiorhodococcus drewsii]EGV29889.1 hypothetical protein ThidrDRAFT_3009 [Thiorhodococcus drewsii AZ1]
MRKSKGTRCRVRKKDYDRVVLTETLPFDTPIIFSNDGFYENLKRSTTRISNDILDMIQSSKKPTIPFHYKIRRNSTEYRRLSIIHPSAQYRIRNIYQEYDEVILHYSRISPASIRAPHRKTSVFYLKNHLNDIYKFKSGIVSTTEMEKFARHAPSFFSYRGFNRLYEFFESPDYFRLEKKYSIFWSLDVSKCFDSIYTHSLSWAIKGKNFTKEHKAVSTTFAQAFDSAMQNANHQETNGIIIGPEASRIFAELIFQAIDRKVIQTLEDRCKYQFDEQYCFRRYVDDVYIFAITEIIAAEVYNCYANELLAFNLHTNSNKLVKITRPFFTKKSMIIQETRRDLANFLDKFLGHRKNDNAIFPKKIYSTWKLTRSFIDAIKSNCKKRDVDYHEVSSYIVSTASKRIEVLVKIAPEPGLENEEKYADAIVVLLDILFFFYSVAPTVTGSYKISRSIVLVSRFSKKCLPIYQDRILQLIYDLAENYFESKNDTRVIISDELSLEYINVSLALAELGDKYSLPDDTVKKIFNINNEMSYFHWISALFYVRNARRYSEIMGLLEQSAYRFLDRIQQIETDAEICLVFMDLVSCPYLSNTIKKKAISEYCKARQISPPTKAEKETFINTTTKWFVDWKNLDLLQALEKKELKRMY